MKTLKTYIDNNGRIAIPAKIRKFMHLHKGNKVSIQYNESELIISTFHSKIDKARDILKSYENINLQKELKDLREEDLKNDSK